MKREFVFFTLGALAGSITTYFVVKKRCENLIQEEIDSVKEVFSRRPAVNEGDDESQKLARLVRRYDKVGRPHLVPDDPRPSLDEVMAEEAYQNHPVDSNEDEGPYIISIEDFSEGCPNYDKLSFNYYELNDVLTDDQDGVIDDHEALVGEALDNFGALSDDPDVVYVRNDKASTDIEITRQYTNFEEVTGLKIRGGDEEDGDQ